MAQVNVTGKRQRDEHGESPEPKRSSSKTSKEKRVRRQLWTSESGISVENSVKAALNLSTVPEELLCRNEESAKVEDFCRKHIKDGRPGSMYVCGCPGTGKTLTMETIKRKAAQWSAEVGSDLRIVGINCMTLTEPRQIFQKVLDSLAALGGRSSPGKRDLSALTQLKASLSAEGNTSRSNAFTLIVLDEMDHLMTRDQSVLYDMFMLPAAPKSQCILIGIANAIDLTERFLPKLRSLKCDPDVVTFPAYTKEQLLLLLEQRLQVFPFPVFEARALELCSRVRFQPWQYAGMNDAHRAQGTGVCAAMARRGAVILTGTVCVSYSQKVSAASGDMRKALDICRSALEVLEAEVASESESRDGEACAAACPDCESDPDCCHPQIVQIGHMAAALSTTFKSAVVQTIQSLPQHQQMVLCSTVRQLKGRQKDASLVQVTAAYVALCKQTCLVPQSVAAVVAILGDLSDQALLAVGKGKDEKKRRITLKVHEDDVNFALQGVRFFRNILSVGAPSSMGA